MTQGKFAAAFVALLLAAGCAGASTTTPVPVDTSSTAGTAGGTGSSAQRSPQDASGALADPGFESGGTTIWTQCGTVNATVQKTTVHSGTYAMQAGSASSEPNGNAALCQNVTIPTGSPKITLWTYEKTNETSTTYAYQELSLRSASNTSTVVATLWKGLSTSGWTQRSYDLSAYAGQTVKLYFGVHGNGASGYYVGLWVDDVAITGGNPTPTPAPTATPTGAPTATPAPTPTPTGTPYPCNDQQFLTYQSEFANGTITADQFVDVCGSVTQVLPAKKTSSGNHGYFYVQMPSGYQIEIVSNLDAMAQAPTNQPPATWPWVSVGQYVYVQGRYYYDSSSSQGIDWTEDDTSSSWQHVGWVVVCNSSGASCVKYW
jgi:Immune inhibitor A-like, MAM domain